MRILNPDQTLRIGMTTHGTTTIAEGSAALELLIEDIAESGLNWNEAETRFQIIDRIIVDCLGWPRSTVRPEQSDKSRTYSDYELGRPRCAIWEAKRINRPFELPADPMRKTVVDLPSIISLRGEVAAAVDQVQSYCVRRGVDIAVATNGHQLIAFLASRRDGVPPLEGRCFVISGYDQLKENFPIVWQMLSPAGVAERKLDRLLRIGEDRTLRHRLSDLLSDYPRYRYPSDFQASLRTLGELLLIDVVDQPDTEKEFYERCYCESGALSQHALVSKQMLAARYAALFSREDKAISVQPVQTGADKRLFTPSVMTEVISRRPVVLLGDVGVGKTSFLKHLMYVSAFEEFQNAIYIYIDLGSQGALSLDLRDFVLEEIEIQLYELYEIDVREDRFVRGVYHLDIQRFKKSLWGKLHAEDPSSYLDRLVSLLHEKTEARDRHLKAAVDHIISGRKKQVIIVLDNADQRDDELQQEAFIVAQNLASDWKASVFVAVRPKTYFRSKQAGPLTGYPNRVFTISPPRVDRVIEKRLEFALSIAEGRVTAERLQNITLQLANIATFIKVLQYSLSKNNDLVEFLSNITAGNIRAVVDFVTKFIGSANVNARKILAIMDEGGRYVIPIHEFWKAALLGEYSYYDPNSSMAFNLFDIANPNSNEHFLASMILAYLHVDGEHRSNDGFVSVVAIVEEMQGWAFTPKATESVLRRANNKKLVETPRRVTFEESASGFVGEMPDFFRISTIGAYHLTRWISEFSYLDAMAYDTPILDADVHEEIGKRITSFRIDDRLARAELFRRYLSKAWHSSNLAPAYFDWNSVVSRGESSFDKVRGVVGS